MPLTRRFWRRTMVRRLFASYTLIILFLGGTMASVIYLSIIFPISPEFRTAPSRARNFMSHRIASMWEEPERLREFASQMEVSFDKSFIITDNAGRDRYRSQRTYDTCFMGMAIKDLKTQEPLGHAKMCDRRMQQVVEILKIMLPFLGLIVFILIASWFVARSLTRPIKEMSVVASDFGDGELSRRAEITLTAGGELATLGRVFNDMAQRIETQINEQHALLAAVSHELRTPLGHMRLLVEMGREGNWSPERLDQLEQEVMEMDDLVDQLLVNSRMNFDLQETSPIHSTELILQAAERAGLDPTLLNVEHEALVFVDATLILRALANMIRNAQNHAGGTTALGVSRHKGGVCFWVEDRGPGIAQDISEQLFEPFVQQDSPHNTSGTLGLGLYLIKRIAQAHHGYVVLESCSEEASHGTRIGICLPAMDPVD